MRKLVAGVRLLNKYAMMGIVINTVLVVFTILFNDSSTFFTVSLQNSPMFSLYVLATLVIMLLLMVIAFYRYLVPAFDRFVDHDWRYHSASVLVKISCTILTVMLLFIILLLYIMLFSLQISIFFVGVFYIILIVEISFSCILTVSLFVSFLRLSRDLNEKLFVYAAVIGVIGLVLSLMYYPVGIALAYVYYLLLYLACRSVLNRVD